MKFVRTSQFLFRSPFWDVKYIIFQPSTILRTPNLLTLRKLSGRVRSKSAALFNLAMVSLTLLSGSVNLNSSTSFDLIIFVVIQKAKYYVCEYSPAGNIIGQFL
jgi:hypothetical protein